MKPEKASEGEKPPITPFPQLRIVARLEIMPADMSVRWKGMVSCVGHYSPSLEEGKPNGHCHRTSRPQQKAPNRQRKQEGPKQLSGSRGCSPWPSQSLLIDLRTHQELWNRSDLICIGLLWALESGLQAALAIIGAVSPTAVL